MELTKVEKTNRRCIKCGTPFVAKKGNASYCLPCSLPRRNTSVKGQVEIIRYKNSISDMKCYFCHKRSGRLVAHHIDMDTSDNSKQNLIILCPSCHSKLHAKIYTKIFKGYA